MKSNKFQNFRSTLCGFFKEHKAAIIVMAFLFIVRMALLYETGIEYNLESDDLSYVKSGIYFANTGTITMHNEYPSAQIMPGMTVLIGVFSLLFGEGKLLWLVLKLLWMAMGTLCAWYIYKSVYLFAPKWCGVVATLPLFRPDFVWMDSVLLTETPFLLCLVMMVYYTLKMGKENSGYKNFIWCMVAYMLALMFKANIAPYPLFALVYLLIVKYDRKLLLKQCAVLACVVLCFIIPWSVRNYMQFHTFVPLTYGAGNPTLLGTYQGRGFPPDEGLDYETNVDEVVKKEYAEFYDEDGNVLPQYVKYVSLQSDGIKAEYRLKEWFKSDPVGFIYSFLVLKPLSMMNTVFYWRTCFGIGVDLIHMFPYLEIFLCIFVAVAALIIKKFRSQIFFLLSLYIGNIYIYAATFSFNRYNASIIYLRYIAIGIGLAVIIPFIAKGCKTVLDANNKIEKQGTSD